MVEKPIGLRDRMRAFLRWSKVITLVVLITLFVVVLLQNFVNADAKLVLIVVSWTLPTGAVVLVSFTVGVLLTVLVVFLRRGSEDRSQ